MVGPALHLCREAVGKKEKAKVIRLSGKFEVCGRADCLPFL